MGGQLSCTLNQIEELLTCIRKETEKTKVNEAIAQDIEDTVSQIDQSIEGNPGLKSLARLLQSDLSEDVATMMMEKGIGVCDPMSPLQVTPLHIAAYFGAVKTLLHLCSLPNVDFRVKTKAGDSVLMYTLYGAKSDVTALCLLRILLSAGSSSVCTVQNNSCLFPLCVAIKRNFEACTKLLTVKPLLRQYEPLDLLYAMTLALVNNGANLIDSIVANWSERTEREVLGEIRKLPALSPDMIDMLESLQLQVPCSRSVTPQYAEGFDPSDELFLSFYLPLAYPKVVEDASGHELKPGDIVKTLSYQLVKRALPQGTSDKSVDRIADAKAIILDILADERLYIEVAGKRCITQIKAFAVVFVEKGSCVRLADGTMGCVGTFVQVLPSEVEVVQLTGEPGWVDGMECTCGKTGKIVRITKNSDVLVQFGWGHRYYFRAAALLQSSPDSVEIQDIKSSKWMRADSVAFISLFRDALIECQNKQGLPYEGEYTQLPSKYVTIKRIYIKAYSLQRIVQVVYEGRDYFVSIECLSAVDAVSDRSGQRVRCGDDGEISGVEGVVKDAQKPEFGGWVNAMADYVGQLGKLIQIRTSLGQSNGLISKIQFSDQRTFYFNPRAIVATSKEEIISQEKVTNPRLSPVMERIGWKAENERQSAASIGFSKTIERIQRSDITCVDTLKRDGLGQSQEVSFVYKGRWIKNGRMMKVAVKKKNFGLTLSSDGLMKEADTLHVLSGHPNIVTLYGVSHVRDLWIIMEYVDGNNLFELLSSVTPVEFSFMRKLKLCMDMCNAVAFVHGKGYVHGDIRPHHMVVDRLTDKLYLVDFSKSIFLDAAVGTDCETRYTSSVIGMPYYVSPECLQPDVQGRYRQPKFPADVWAVGVVLFELFTRTRLARNSIEFIQDKMTNNDVRLKAKLSKLPPPVQYIVGKALSFPERDRPTASALVDFFRGIFNKF